MAINTNVCYPTRSILTIRRALALVLCAAPLPYYSPAAQMVADSSSCSASASPPGTPSLDFQDPKTFVRVIEQTNHHNIFTVFAPRKSCYGSDSTEDEVDRASTIRIQFEKAAILADTTQSLDGDITITATVTKPDGSKPPIEVLGYSTIGEKAKVAAVRIRSGDQLISSLSQISDVFNPIQAEIDSARHSAIHAPSAKLTGPAEDSTRDRTIARLQTTQDSVRRIASTSADSAVLLDSADALRRLVLQREQADQELLSQDDAALTASLEAQRRIILDSRDVLQILLARLARPADTATFSAVMTALGHDPEAVSARAASLVDSALPTVARLPASNAAGRDTLSRAINKILNTLREFADAGLDINLRDGALRNSLAHTFLNRLSEGDIVVAETGAQPGDIITIDVVNQPVDSAQPPHELHLRLLVQEFGLVPHTTDSFLFIKRLGVHSSGAPASGTGSVMDTAAAAYNYLPTAGVTHGWVLNWRRQWGRGWAPDIVRFFQPGFGLNVSFPRFGTRVTEFTPTSGATPATVSVSDASSNDGFDLAIGGVLTLFNGSLQVTYGANLTSGHPRSYWGLGFSFIRTISAGTQLASSSK